MRQVWQLSPQELRAYGHRRTPCGRAWQDFQAHMGDRDVRGIRKWVFIWGWLAAAAYYERYFSAVEERLRAANEAELRRIMEKFDRDSGVRLLKG